MEKIKDWWAHTKEWAIKSPVRCSIIGVVLLPIITLIVLLLRYGGFCRDEWAGLAGGLLAYAGTCFVGILAVWQNNRAHKVNEKLMDINRKMIKVEQRRYKMAVNLSWEKKDGKNIEFSLQNICDNTQCEILLTIVAGEKAIKSKKTMFLRPESKEILFWENIDDYGTLKNFTSKKIYIKAKCRDLRNKKYKLRKEIEEAEITLTEKGSVNLYLYTP